MLYRLTYINMLGATGVTTTPSRCTSGGSWLMTWSTRFLTATTARLGSVPSSKITWTVASPALVESETMYFMPGTPLSERSRGISVDLTSTSADEPG